MRWRYPIAALLALALVGLGPAGISSQAAEPPPAGTTLDVSGTGSVDVVPDLATISLGVMTRGATAAEAVTANNAGMQALIAALHGAGVTADRIRTANFYVGPVYLPPKDPTEAAKIGGFEASNMVQADLDDPTAVGHIIDVALGAGATQIHGVGFTLKDRSAPERQALALAVADARLKAQAIASAAGLTLGAIRSISYESTGAPYPPGLYGMGGGGGETPISTGQQAVAASVHVSFGAS